MKHENYRRYIQSEFERRKIRNPHYSLRAFARDLRVSPSRLSEALNSRRGISAELAQKLILAMGLEDLDAEVFLLSVLAEHSRSEKQREKAKVKLTSVLSAVSEAPPKTLTIVDWVAEAILKMSERQSVTDDVEAVAQNLGVPSFMVTDALRFLARLGFVTENKKFKTYLQNRGKGRRLNIDYIQILEQAQKAYSGSISEGHFQHEAVLLEKKNLDRAHRILKNAVDEIRSLETKTKNSKVMFIANQIFSVEKERKKP